MQQLETSYTRFRNRPHILIATAILAVSLLATCAAPNKQSRDAPTPYELPSKVTLDDVTAEWESNGDITVSAKTNLPPGTKLVAFLADQPVSKQLKHFAFAVAKQNEVQNGRFTVHLKKTEKGISLGKHKIGFFAEFLDGIQSPQVMSIVGKGGSNLKGDIFKREDPDVRDSDIVLDYTVTVEIPAIKTTQQQPQPSVDPSEERAIELVKKAVLSTPENGRSTANVEGVIKFLLVPGTGMSRVPGKEWEASRNPDGTYTVTFYFINGTASERGAATWSADLRSKKVRYLDKNAKTFSYLD